ncbi:MAG TPA: aspartate dehydrogenase domain-containing protein [Sphingomonadaceae bacterium]|nr:aspartate dehydrogenase domain-containing protein [Sphingomonadaceae bacterium]
MQAGPLKVGIVGFGVIGQMVAGALDGADALEGLELAGLTVRDPAKAAPALARLSRPVPILPVGELVASADIVFDAAVAAAMDEIAPPAIEAGKIFVTMNSGALLARPELFRRAEETGARIMVPSGGIVGFDGLRALSRAGFDSVTLISRKPPESLADAPHVVAKGYDLSSLTEAMLIFEGNAAEAARAFPANANVAATLSLATLGPEGTQVQMWADPHVTSLYQEIHVNSPAAKLQIKVESQKMPDNPRTGSLTPLSAISMLASLASRNRIGS